MYIVPNSTIRLLRNVRLEPDYINTIYFSTLANQTNYFMGKTKYTLSTQSYQRKDKGVCRVNYKAEDLYDCNYMMFQNSSFGTKWFYAFITRVEYVNNITADVYYEIDVMQTWLKDITFSMCFVEREHSGSDNIGDNIVPEPIETGEMVFNDYDKLTTDLDDMAIAVATVDVNDSGVIVQGNLIDGIYSGARVKCYSTTSTGISNLNDYLETFKQKPDAVVGVYVVPRAATGQSVATLDSGVVTSFSSACEHYEYTKTALTPSATIDGHVVRNKKLFTYPYNYYHIDNANGRELNLRYEFFTSNLGVRNLTPQFKMFCNLTMPVTTVLRPTNYKGVKSNDYVKTESIDLTGYPMCSWNMDSWKAWIAQNSVPEAISAYAGGLGIGAAAAGSILAATGAGAAVAMGAAALTAGAAVGALASGKLSEMYKASIKADICKGSLNNANINVSSGIQTFFAGRVSVNKQTAEIIDDYFDRFGYATNRVKVPNITSRRNWNYIKTIGSNVDGNIAGDDKQKIDTIFNSGITFWHNGDNIDNYSLDNSPVSP